MATITDIVSKQTTDITFNQITLSTNGAYSLLFNSIPTQQLLTPNSLTIQKWNDYLNQLRVQTNEQTTYLRTLDTYVTSTLANTLNTFQDQVKAKLVELYNVIATNVNTNIRSINESLEDNIEDTEDNATNISTHTNDSTIHVNSTIRTILTSFFGSLSSDNVGSNTLDSLVESIAAHASSISTLTTDVTNLKSWSLFEVCSGTLPASVPDGYSSNKIYLYPNNSNAQTSNSAIYNEYIIRTVDNEKVFELVGQIDTNLTTAQVQAMIDSTFLNPMIASYITDNIDTIVEAIQDSEDFTNAIDEAVETATSSFVTAPTNDSNYYVWHSGAWANVSIITAPANEDTSKYYVWHNNAWGEMPTYSRVSMKSDDGSTSAENGYIYLNGIATLIYNDTNVIKKIDADTEGFTTTKQYVLVNNEWQEVSIPDNTPIATTIDSTNSSTNTSVPGTGATVAYIESLIATSASKASKLFRLDSNGLIPTEYLPSYVDDAIEGKLEDGHFYKAIVENNTVTGYESTYVTPTIGVIYVDVTNSTSWRYSGTAFTQINAPTVIDVIDVENRSFLNATTKKAVLPIAGSYLGLVRQYTPYNFGVTSSNGSPYCNTRTYAEYQSLNNASFISKGTLENVITGKLLLKTTLGNYSGTAFTEAEKTTACNTIGTKKISVSTSVPTSSDDVDTIYFVI